MSTPDLNLLVTLDVMLTEGSVERDDACFLSGSGVHGETVPCSCR